MEMTTFKNIAMVNCDNSSSIASLTIINDNVAVVRFKSDPDTTYTYMTDDGMLAKLVELDSAGKFVASYLKPRSTVLKSVPK